MEPTDKQKRERAILDLVYGDDYPEVTHRDSPDFILQDDQRCFGVEVTDLYRDESDARLKLVPGYMTALLSGGRPIHKDDVHNLNVVTVEVRSPDGELVAAELTGIMRPEVSMKEHYEQLADVIERKNASFARYAGDLGHTNLVVADSVDVNVHGSGELTVAEILTPRVREALRTTPFRSVILVSNAGFKTAVYRPLDCLWLCQEYFMFMKTLYGIAEAVEQFEPEDCVPAFVRIMQTLDMPVVARREGTHLWAGLGGFGARYENGLKVHDYADRELPPEAPIPEIGSAVAESTLKAVTDAFLQIREEASLVFDYSMPVKKTDTSVFAPMTTVSLAQMDEPDGAASA